MDKLKIVSELFAIPYNDNYIIYAPLKHIVFVANSAAVRLIQYIQRGKEIEEDIDTKVILEQLRSTRIIEGTPEVIPPKPSAKEFSPTLVTLFPTSNCNLRCVYCYASAGENPRYMPWEIAKSAIDLVVNNAQTKGTNVSVGFHGNGEPTFNWRLFTRCINYAKETTQKNNLKLHTASATNGILTEKQVDWIIGNMNSLNISFDGPKDIQDQQRPMKDSGGSYDVVFNTVKQLDTADFHYGIRATITKKSVRRMTEMVHFFHENFKTKHLHFEPLYFCGRCKHTGWDAPPMDIFIGEFIKALEVAESFGIKLIVSGMRLDTITVFFCGSSTGNFTVTPDGWITACYETTSVQDPYANLFFFGKYNEATGKFEIFQDRFEFLRNMTIHNIEYCADCFCKWHCAGDCPHKSIVPNDYNQRRGTDRCQMVQELTKYQLIRLLSDDKYKYSLKVKPEIYELNNSK
ncbi:radical SAM protein [Candidatus Poribacteria bacterium]|nr:radical SAM protein [Candidatus Poribacteria bacterium]